ncbi:MAG TPA: HD domain-containing phosphohydrolase [Acidimicrobiales bacterium]|nr:HD domain-containing phosphohydrolase [Acidimicrobiales bacterium]
MAEHVATARLADLTIALSLATDLGTGQPMDHGLRTCWLSLAAAEALGLDDAARSCVYYVALLRFVGCTSGASETAVLAGGDDVGFNAAMAPVVNAPAGEGLRWFVRHLAEDLPLHRRVGRVLHALGDPGSEHRSLSGHCEVAARLAARLHMADPVCDALAHAYERWDGKGHPDGLAGDEVPLAVRVVAAARDAELWTRLAGWAAATEVLGQRRDRTLDPAVVDALLAGGEAWLAGIGDDPCAAVQDAEPGDPLTIDGDGLDAALAAVADFTDLKVPSLRGHSPGVAALVRAAAAVAGVPPDTATMLRRAALVHDVGRVGIANGIWDRPGPLTSGQWERVRLHPYLGERVLRRCTILAPLADVAAHHHERADGSGYHRGASGDQIGFGARLLAAADAYHAMTEDRPHRPALHPADAATLLVEQVDGGRFGRKEVDAVLQAAGQTSRPPNVARPADLTEREIDVLRLIARGRSNRGMAATLGISPKTVGHHVEHTYAKAGVRTRAGAALFAMEHGLLPR